MKTSDFRNFAASMIGSSGIRAKLRNGTTDRICDAALLQWSPREKSLRLEGSRRAIISAIDPLTGGVLAPPDFENEKFVFNGNVYRMPLPDDGPRVDGTPGYFELEVIYDSRDV